MKISHRPVFTFDEHDVQDRFLWCLRKPDALRLRWDDDGYGAERNLDKLISTRRENGLPEVALLNQMQEEAHQLNTPRRFIPLQAHKPFAVLAPIDSGSALFDQGCRFLEADDRHAIIERQFYVWARYRVTRCFAPCDVLYFLNPLIGSLDRRLEIGLNLRNKAVTMHAEDLDFPLDIKERAKHGDEMAKAFEQIYVVEDGS